MFIPSHIAEYFIIFMFILFLLVGFWYRFDIKTAYNADKRTFIKCLATLILIWILYPTIMHLVIFNLAAYFIVVGAFVVHTSYELSRFENFLWSHRKK